MKTTYHKNNTITFFSVYSQTWIRRTSRISDEELAARPLSERLRICRHLGVRL